MINRQLPKQKKTTVNLPADAYVSRHASRVRRIAHELINQLSVLALLGDSAISANQPRSAGEVARDIEMFDRCLREATLLAEQLAYCVTSPREMASVEGSPTVPNQGTVV
jgi:hypothetical protein